MKIAIASNPVASERLQFVAASLGVNDEELAQAAVTDLIGASAHFKSAASRVLHKNRGLYQRLAQ